MARKTKRSEFHVIEFTCNRCEKTFADQETEEALHYHASAGYHCNTAIGDGTLWSIDLCQYCVRDLLGPYIQKHDSWITREVWTEKGIDAPGRRPEDVFKATDIISDDPLDQLGRKIGFELAVQVMRQGLDD